MEGVQTTCIITVLAVLFGSILAFGICILRRTGSRLANLISNIFMWVFRARPTVALPMILYYVVFGRTGLAAIWVAVIRSLAAEGMTMMIVTHEIRFARNVSSRVFYMDEGGIYEEGTPEQIFENPRREKTRIFIRHLKMAQFTIPNADFDSFTAISKLESFGADAALLARTQRRFTLAFEELVLQTVMPVLRERARGFPIGCRWSTPKIKISSRCRLYGVATPLTRWRVRMSFPVRSWPASQANPATRLPIKTRSRWCCRVCVVLQGPKDHP